MKKFVAEINPHIELHIAHQRIRLNNVGAVIAPRPPHWIRPQKKAKTKTKGETRRFAQQAAFHTQESAPISPTERFSSNQRNARRLSGKSPVGSGDFPKLHRHRVV